MGEQNAVRYELTTIISVDGLPRDRFDAWVLALDAAIFEETGSYPAVKQYFVSGNVDAMEVEVGLAFEGADPTEIESMADRMVEDALETVLPGDPPLPQTIREESTLVPA